MNLAKITKTGFGMLLGLLVTACATTGSQGDLSEQAQYQRSIPVCVGAQDCHAKMNAARDWVAANTGFEMVVNSDDRIETGGWGMHAVPSLSIERAAIGGGRDWILIDVDCGSAEAGDSFGVDTCPSYWPTVIDFNMAVSSAQ